MVIKVLLVMFLVDILGHDGDKIKGIVAGERVLVKHKIWG